MITLAQDGPIWTVTIDRPDKAGALTEAMLEDLVAAVNAAAARPPRALILTGTGTVFSAGADLAAAKAGLATSALWEVLSGGIAALPCLTIAALNGTVAGGATGMVLACDLRLAVPRATFFYPVMRLGYLPQPSDPARLAALVGPSRAKMILLAGQRIDTDTALAWGLIDACAAPETLLEDARAFCADVCAAQADTAAAIKALCP